MVEHNKSDEIVREGGSLQLGHHVSVVDWLCFHQTIIFNLLLGGWCGTTRSDGTDFSR